MSSIESGQRGGKVRRSDRWFDNGHIDQNLRRASVRGGAVTAGGQVLSALLTFGSTAILGRLLWPEDYGKVTMVTVVTGLVGIIGDVGLSMATIQSPTITRRQISALFWINVLIGCLLAILVASMGPVLSLFYSEPSLTEITYVLSSCFIFSALMLQHQALLSRHMRFLQLTIIDILSQSIGALSAIVLAWKFEMGYWSLVYMQVVTAIVRMLATWGVVRWLPDMRLRGCNVRPMLKFGGNLAGFNFANYFARNGDNMLIGQYWGDGPLGIYSRAYSILMLPLRQVNAPLATVAIPALSRLQNEPERYRAYFLKASEFLMLFTAPIIALLIVLADEVVYVLLGAKWAGIVPVFRCLAISAFFQPLFNSTGWLFISSGQTSRMLKHGIGWSVFLCISFCIGLPFGISGVALCYSIAILILTPVALATASHGTSVTLYSIVCRMSPILSSAIVAMILGYLMKCYVDLDSRVLVTILSGMVIVVSYVIAIFGFLNAGKSALELWKELTGKKG